MNDTVFYLDDIRLNMIPTRRGSRRGWPKSKQFPCPIFKSDSDEETTMRRTAKVLLLTVIAICAWWRIPKHVAISSIDFVSNGSSVLALVVISGELVNPNAYDDFETERNPALRTKRERSQSRCQPYPG